ncbi:GGDEF domain-containing protein [Dactylosporangium sp. NPDC051485]|uniref:GGDEF domain-containing protein n=1 Tax=Dactylosporangium sp. NPDC051485 TaxID=3154846 RepID=UPI0034338E01
MNHITAGVLACIVELLQVAAFSWWWRRRADMFGVDGLTGLRNRDGLYDALRGLRSAPGMLLLDLNGFKAVNDHFGHDTGDAMLRGVAARLTEIAPPSAVIGRLGGDEFVLLLPDAITRDQLIEAAGLVRAAVSRAQPLPTGDGTGGDRPVPGVSCVVGLALPGALPDPSKPFRAADIALYHARHHGLPYALYQPGMTHPAAADRHGDRLRDRRPAPPTVVFDNAAFHQHTEPDHTHLTDAEMLRLELAGDPQMSGFPEFLQPHTHGFGTDVADLVQHCAELGVFRWRAPITAVVAEPTTVGAYRDGGLRVLVTVNGTLTLASPQWRPDSSTTRHDGPVASTAAVLDAIAALASQLYTTYETTLAAPTPGRPPTATASTVADLTDTTGPVPTPGTTFTAAIADLRTATARAGSGTLTPPQTTEALIAAGDLATRLDLRAFEVSTDVGSDDLKELVVMTVHGVDLEIRGRYGPHGVQEIYVHIDDRRPEEETAGVPLVVEVYPS